MKRIFLLFLISFSCAALFAQTPVKTKPAAKPVQKTTVAKPVSKPVQKTTATKQVAKTVTKVAPKDKSIRLKLTTDSGVIIFKLYDSTPLHRDNFVKLVTAHFYDSLLFHRVIPEFMVQGGDPSSKNATPSAMLGSGGGDMERIPAEFVPAYFHKKGALAAARDNNPEKKSSAVQFYIVEGKKYSNEELNMIEQQQGAKFSAEQRLAYTTVGGTPFLDKNYTVFGETLSGFGVINKIANAPRDGMNRPLGDIKMKIEIIK